jgi:hypothetical protein
MMRRSILILVVVLSLGSEAAAAAEPAMLRATIAPVTAWVGQRVVINLELLVRGTFSGTPAFDLPSVPGAVLIPPATSPVLGTETIGGDSYTSQLYHVAIFAQRPDDLVIPPIGVRFAGVTSPGTPATSYSLTSPELSLLTKMPPGAEGLATIISSADLTVEQSWQPAPRGSAKVGDAITRTIRLAAPDVPGMALPPLPLSGVEGVAAYPGQPVIQDRSERGRTSGERIETVTYVFQRPGSFTLPGIVLRWWNIDRRAIVEKRLPPALFEVTGAAPNGTSVRDAAAPPTRRSGRALLLTGMLLTFLVVAIGLAIIMTRARRDPEHRAFRRFVAACRQGDPQAIYAALTAWRRIAGLGIRGTDRAFDAAVADLETVLFAPASTPTEAWRPTRLLELGRQERRRRKTRRRTGTTDKLLPINPSSDGLSASN